MARGHPDWRPPSESVSVALAFVTLSGTGDIIANPGAGFRLSLYLVLVSSDAAGATTAVIVESTSADVLVRTLARLNLPNPTTAPPVPFFGLPLGENNKLRLGGVPGGTLRITVLYTTEAV